MRTFVVLFLCFQFHASQAGHHLCQLLRWAGPDGPVQRHPDAHGVLQEATAAEGKQRAWRDIECTDHN